MVPRILINSTDAELYLWLEYILATEGFQVELSDGIDRQIDSEVLAVVIDCRLTGDPSEQCCASMDQLAALSVPLVALVEGDDRKLHLDLIKAGAERFHRPISPRRLVDYLLRLSPTQTMNPEQRSPGPKSLRFAEIQIDLASHRVICADEEIYLPPLEFKLLVLLLSKQGQVCSRDELIEAAWPATVFVEPRTVDVHVGRLRRTLRRSLRRDPIRTVRSIGYALNQN